MDFGGFIGRFHPLFVHLPIGLLLLAGIFEYFARKPKYKNIQKAVSITLFIGALSAIFSSISGWLLANRGAYIEQSLFLHRWLGIAVAVFASLCWLIKTNRIRVGGGIFKMFLGLMVVGVFATGHFGGQMTHGEDYLLEYAPSFIKKMFDFEKEEVVYNFESYETIKVYDDLLAPIFEDQCWKCHNKENPLGGFDMTSKGMFLKGGINGKVLELGEAYESELFRRVTMPVSDRKSMPPFGLALPFNKIKLIEWWINNGASFEKNLSEVNLSNEIKDLLTEEYGISFVEKSALEKIEVEPASIADLEEVRQAGFVVANISEDNNLLDVEVQKKGNAVSVEQLAILAKIKEQVTWLSLPESQIAEPHMESLNQFKNLTRLRLQGNPITDEGIKQIENLPTLESLNLIGTDISDQSLVSIKKMINLKSLYIFQTKLTTEALESLSNTRPDLEIVKAFQFKKIEE